MSAPQQRSEKTWAVMFAGFLTIALGGAGLLVAALAVGIEQAWTGGAQERSRSGERASSWFDAQREWLAADHQRRLDRGHAVRSWVAAGSPADRRPTKPARAAQFGVALRRAFANACLGAVDFGRGVRKGWVNADQVRRDGGQFQDMWRGRRGPDDAEPASGDDRSQPEAETSPDEQPEGETPAPEPETVTAVPDSGPAGVEAQPASTIPPVEPVQGPDPAADEVPKSANPTQHNANNQDVPATSPLQSPPVPASKSMTIEGEIVSQPTTETAAASQAESNAAVLRGLLSGINDKVGEVADVTDSLAAVRSALQSQVQQADEFATSTGQSAQARQALDATNSVVAQMGKHLNDFADGSVHAQDQLGQASDGLRVAEDADDQLRSAGADGRAVAPAGAHA